LEEEFLERKKYPGPIKIVQRLLLNTKASKFHLEGRITKACSFAYTKAKKKGAGWAPLNNLLGTLSPTWKVQMSQIKYTEQE